MGCGGSKLEGEDDASGRLRPLLWRRIEEIRRRRNTALRGPETLSKKELLKGTSDDDNSSKSDSPRQNDDRQLSMCLQEENLKVAPVPTEYNETTTKDKPAKNVDEHGVVAPPLVGFSKVAPAPEPAKSDDAEKCIREEGKGDKEKEEKEMEAIATAMELVGIITKTDGDTEGEEREDMEGDNEYGRLSNVDEGCIGPGSPSFRVYFIESLAKDEKDDEDEQHNTDKVSEDAECVEASVESSNSPEDTETKIKKKGKRSAGMRFRRVIAKRRPGAVKNLLNVTSCYNPACSGSDKTHLLAPKAVS